MGLTKLRRRMQALEQSLAATDQTAEARHRSVLQRISLEQLELLIAATLAPLQGRDLTAGETEAQRAYAEALELEYRLGGWTRFGPLDAAELISVVHLRQLPEETLLLNIDGLRTLSHGGQPTEAQLAALQVNHDGLEALYRRFGFDSPVEFGQWYCTRTRSP